MRKLESLDTPKSRKKDTFMASSPWSFIEIVQH
ncbi:hypothetical protein LOK49_LG03G01837 [Camellia lanceoleosa]|uniref:Uncharacterized protein n=1 Tax=Camellia lanceoleosa TaxID=1840588 RepID=A0ACC0IB48_9ERIC|nr:hypothetical protein LOK49_LG03G01837 [Camellia lanceoleosa]